ncbi:hypothetical protein QBC37DRAFT_289278 [Rhypophila decipiens]|uniref:Uncharacterized protein n=1 Tax=Rhypophila decipiens TaxID=261697 RepID=A0AAN7B3Y5_9PEZI|nr:hypothetical protein QBC37DRAFT_289278 [Rhypophila decipiens]
MALYGPGFQRPPTEDEKKLGIVTAMSPNYMGNPGNMLNYSDSLIANEDNCSFWLTGLPPDVTVHELLSSIRDCGRIFAMHINREAINVGNYHMGAGAKLVFMTKAGATNFYNRYVRTRSMCIRGWVPRICRNRIKVREQSGVANYKSRCLRITGPADVVNPAFLIPWLEERLVFQVDEIIMHPSYCNTSVMEIRFSSFRSQANFAFMAMIRSQEFRELPNFFVRWVRDPCDATYR